MTTYYDPSDEPEQPQSNDFTPIPAGWYHATIVEAAPHFGSNSVTGEMIKLCVEIDGNEHPEYSNRKVFAYLCINHSGENPITRQVARANLNKILRATGFSVLEDPSDLLGGTLMVQLKIKPPQNGYEAGNDIKGWKGSGQPTPQPRAQQPKTAPLTTGEERAPSVKDRSWGN